MNKYGLLDSPVNEEIHVYDNLEFVYGATVKLPEKFSLVTPPVRDQAYSAWCVSFGVTAMQFCDDLVRLGSAVPLSTEYVHKNCKAIDGIKNAYGTYLESGCKVIINKGACRDSLLPFDDMRSRTNDFVNHTTAMINDATNHKSKSYARVSTIEKVKEAIYYQNGVIIGMTIFKNFEGPKGYIQEPPHAYNTPIVDRHCMFICGWDDNHTAIIEGKEYKGFFKIQDSYGVKSGSNGFRYLAYDLWDSYAYYSTDKLVRECWCTYDTNDLVNPNYHTDRFKPSQDALNVTIKTIMLTLGSNKGTIDGKEFTLLQVPTVVNGTTFVPIRQISELFGCAVSWNQEEKKVTISDTKRKVYIQLYIGKKEATCNLLDKPYALVEAPLVKNGTTLVPIRAISELLKYVVRYDNTTKRITIIA